MIAAAELGLDLQHRKEISLQSGGSAAGELEQIGITLVRHDAGARRQIGRQNQEPVLVGREVNHVGAELGQLVRKLNAPEEHQRLQLAAAVLDQGDVVFHLTEGQRPRGDLALNRQRHSVPCGAAERRAVHLDPHGREQFHRVQDAFRKRRSPQPRRRWHGPTRVGIARP